MLPVILDFGDGLVSTAGWLHFRASVILSVFTLSRNSKNQRIRCIKEIETTKNELRAPAVEAILGRARVRQSEKIKNDFLSMSPSVPLLSCTDAFISRFISVLSLE